MVLLAQLAHKGYKVKMDERGNKDKGLKFSNKNCHSINTKWCQYDVIAPRAVIDGQPAG